MIIRHLTYLFLFVLLVFSCTENKNPNLKDSFKEKFLIGTALNRAQIVGNDPQSLKLALEQFNCFTPENVMKWENVHPQPGIYHFDPVDSLIELCQKNNAIVIGHTLVWQDQMPDWVFKDNKGNPVSRDTLLKRLKDHIFTVVGRYKGKIHGWDVVNEAFNEEGEFRKSNWLKIIGEDYMELAFKWTHEADPNTELYYNDFNMAYVGKREAVVKMVNDFKAKGIPIDGIGLQGHWGMDYPDLDELDTTFKIYSELGINVMVTELELDMLPAPGPYIGADINLKYEAKKELDPWPDSLPDSMQIKIAERYAEFFRLFNKYNASISRITLWGVHDGQSWRNYWPINSRTAYPLLFDRKLKPKKAFYEVIKIAQSKN